MPSSAHVSKNDLTYNSIYYNLVLDLEKIFMMANKNSYPGARVINPISVVLLSGSLITACSGGDTPEASSTPADVTSSSPGNIVPATPNTINGNTGLITQSPVEVTFNSRPGPNPGPAFSNVIKVYPGAGNTAEDEQANGTFLSGQGATATCETVGRTVSTNSSQQVGEQSGITSDRWVRILLAGGITAYATEVYLTNASIEAAETHLPAC
jgi:hypothetical protein